MAEACANIAFVKYWGRANPELNIPVNSSVSMSLRHYCTRVEVKESERVEVEVNGKKINPERVKEFLKKAARFYRIESVAVKSETNIPLGIGLVSSAAFFAALAREMNDYFSLGLDEKELSRLARLGSGSASRSVYDESFVIWHKGRDHRSSFAEAFAGRKHFELVDVVKIYSKEHKKIGSSEGHSLAETSRIFTIKSAFSELYAGKAVEAILERDFEKLAFISEAEALLLHYIADTSKIPCRYFTKSSLEGAKKVLEMRLEGIPVFFTFDAGPTLHAITLKKYAEEVLEKLEGDAIA